MMIFDYLIFNDKTTCDVKYKIWNFLSRISVKFSIILARKEHNAPRVDTRKRIKHNARFASCSPSYMFNAQQLTCDRTSHIKVAPDLSARGMDGGSTIPHRLSAIKSWKVFRLPSSARGGVHRHRFFLSEDRSLHFFKTAARTMRNYCALTYRAHALARSIRMHVCVRVWYESVPHTHIHISSFKRHVTARSVDLLIWNRVRAGTLEKRPGGK